MTLLSTSASPLHLDGDSRALLAISLKEKATPSNIESWTQWLASDAPASVREVDPQIRIEGAFPGASALLLVSIPVNVWHHLEDSTTYRFVDFVADGVMMGETELTTGSNANQDVKAEKETTAGEK